MQVDKVEMLKIHIRSQLDWLRGECKRHKANQCIVMYLKGQMDALRLVGTVYLDMDLEEFRHGTAN